MCLLGDHLQVLSPAVPSDLSSLATNLFGCRDSCSLWQGSYGDICASLGDQARGCLKQGGLQNGKSGLCFIVFMGAEVGPYLVMLQGLPSAGD